MKTLIVTSKQVVEVGKTLDYCVQCGDEVLSYECSESVSDRTGVTIGLAHSGHCAHQWRLSH